MTNSLLDQFKPAKQSETMIISTKDDMMKVLKRSGRPTCTNATMISTDEYMTIVLEGYDDRFSDCICKISKDVWNTINIRKFSDYLINQIGINREKCANNPNLK